MSELVELALRQTGALVRAEAALAAAELRAEASEALLAAASMTAAMAFFALAITSLIVAVLLILGANVLTVSFATAGTLAALGALTLLVTKHFAPKNLLPKSRARIASDVREIEDLAR